MVMDEEKYSFTPSVKDLKKLDLIIKFVNKLDTHTTAVTREDMMSGYIQSSFEQFTEEMPGFAKFVQEEMGL
jgi:hypothetical protein